MSTAVTGPTHCLNCGSALSGLFCGACGQKVTSPDPSFHDLVHDLTHELLHLDGRVVQSIRLLFTRPGFLTREHLEGRRARYTAPIRLYLSFSLIFFVVAIYAPLEMSVRVDAKRGRVLHTGGLDLSGEVLEGRTEAEVAEWVREAQHEWLPRLMFVMVPVFAAFTAMATRRQRRHFPQHLYFALHNHAAWFGILAVAEAARWSRNEVVSRVVWAIAAATVVGYTAIAARRVYGRTWMGTAWQTAWTLFVYGSLLVLATVTLFIALYLGEHRN